jgi:hypothetical protein
MLKRNFLLNSREFLFSVEGVVVFDFNPILAIVQEHSLALTVLSCLFGLFALIFAIFERRSNQKHNRIYDRLFEIADKHIDKTLTEEELISKKNEVEIASKRIEKLEEQIRQDIPIEAKRAVLRDRLNSQVEQLKSFLDSTKNIKKELEKIGETPKIPNNLFDVIEKEISPEYLLREKRSNLKTDLMVCTAAAAISATLLPYPFSRMVSWTILLLGVPILYSLIKTMPRNTVWKRKMIVASPILLFICSAILFFGSVLFVIIWISESERVGNILIYFAIAFFTFAIFWAEELLHRFIYASDFFCIHYIYNGKYNYIKMLP